jgi:hypothetical protein
MAQRKARTILPRDSHARNQYTASLAALILEQLSNGRTLREVCDLPIDGMPSARTVGRWVVDDTEDFAARYHRARRAGAVAILRQARVMVGIALAAWRLGEEKHGDDTSFTPEIEYVTRSLMRIDGRCELAASFLAGE